MKRSFATLNCSSSSDNSNESILMDALKRIMMLFYGRFTTTTEKYSRERGKRENRKKGIGIIVGKYARKRGKRLGHSSGKSGKGETGPFPIPLLNSTTR